MPTDLFFELGDEKRQTIINAAVTEFADFGYKNSSTNRIVKHAGISKGSLFKYFPNKEDLYFYLTDQAVEELISNMEKNITILSSELFQRIIDYSVLEFSWYLQHPEKSKLIINAFTKAETEIFTKTMMRYGSREQDIYYRFIQDIDTKHLRYSKHKTINILKWFLKGFNDEFLSKSQLNEDIDFSIIKDEYVASLTEYMEILKTGLVK